jgi:glycerol-3-phosphate acyltransferase PlsY
LMAAGWAPIVVAFITDGQIFALASVLAVLIYVRHAANIGRLRRGEESKIGKK